MTAIVAEDVRREYGDTVALDGVSLSVGSGEVYALIGPNGAGKTTLVRALTGTTAAGGRVELFGAPPRDVARHRVGLLPQAFSPEARLTARELVGYYAGLYDEARTVEDVLETVGLGDSADVRYEALSGGQRRRACVGLALVNDPDLLVLDEPTTGIDPAGRDALHRTLTDLAGAGTTVLLTTHDMAEAERLADRVGLLADGRLVAEGAPADLVAEHAGEPVVEVAVADEAAATEALTAAGYEPTAAGTGLRVEGVAVEDVGALGEALADAGVAYDELAWRRPGLEEVYLRLTGTGVGRGGEPRDAAEGAA